MIAFGVMQRFFGRVVAGLWLGCAGLGAITTPLAALFFPRVGGRWFPFACAALGLVLGVLLAKPVVWALRAQRSGPAPAAPPDATPQPEARTLFARVVDSRLGLVVAALLGVGAFTLFSFGVGVVGNGVALPGAPVRLACQVVGEQVTTRAEQQYSNIEFECVSPTRSTLSDSFILPLSEVALAHPGRHFELPASAGRLGLWVLPRADQVARSANTAE